MLPSFLITFREVIEASLIVATILGILVKINQQKSIKTVWLATAAAALTSIILLGFGSLFGIEVQKLYSGKIEEFTEGTLMITSALFITFAVFFLHKYFSNYKVKLLQKVKNTVESQEQKGLFILVFTAVFREGFEIVLFLSTVYFSSNPERIFSGFIGGVAAGLVVSFALFTATLRLPIFYAFKTTSILLILFAAGLLARGVHEFAEVGFIPETTSFSIPFFPSTQTIFGNIIHSVFGVTQHMDILQIVFYFSYSAAMVWYVFFRKKHSINASQSNGMNSN